MDYQSRIVGLNKKRASEFKLNPLNPRVHPDSQTAAIRGLFGLVGQFDVVIENVTTGHLIDGHARVKLGIEDGNQTLDYLMVELTDDEEKLVLATLDKIAGMAQTDTTIQDELLSHLATYDDYGDVLSAVYPDYAAVMGASDETEWDESALDDEIELTARDIPDALWPTDNEWGVPVLSLDWQADAADLPINEWGAVGRKSKMNGTYHFYTDDNRFEGLWTDPSPIVNSGCVNVAEPNFSTNIQMPRAVVLWHVYRKRWLARYWQSRGVRIFVDLDVNPLFDELNLTGVPAGWKSYACYMRQSDHKNEELDHFLEVGMTRAQTKDVLLLVIGGNAEVQAMCRERPQCIFAPSFEQRFYRNFRQKTQGG